MQNKLRRILQKQDGIAILIVLCLGALLLALAAALGYAASVLTANANSQLREQEAYQLAVSFSDVLEGELQNEGSEFAKFINGTYMVLESYGTNIYTQESGKTVLEIKGGNKNDANENDANENDANENDANKLQGGADTLTITLQRRPGEKAEDLAMDVPYIDMTDLKNQLNTLKAPDYKIEDLQLDITVTAEKSGAAYAYTVTYDRSAHYDEMYFTIDSQTVRYKWVENTTKFKNPSVKEPFDLDDGVKHTLTVHFNTSKAPSAVSYVRGVRAAQGGTP